MVRSGRLYNFLVEQSFQDLSLFTYPLQIVLVIWKKIWDILSERAMREAQ
jgi:hypothetical protein